MLLTYRAGERDDGRRVYLVLKNDLRLSAERIKRAKYARAVSVNGQNVWIDHLLSPGDTLTVDLALTEPAPDFPPERGRLEIIYEDDALLAVNKPAGLLVHPSRGKYTGTLANFVAGYLADTGGSPVCHAVNRLDRDTSGITLFAKSAYHKSLAIAALQAPGAEKTYTAVLHGVLPDISGTIDLPIAREREGCQKRVVRQDGQRAVTLYNVLSTASLSGHALTLASLTLKTGRTHQIRVHCSHLGAPVLGDRLYGNEACVALSDELHLTRHLLHASCLTLIHPLTHRPLTLFAPAEEEEMTKITAKCQGENLQSQKK